VDGRATSGSIDDYWIQYGSSAQDPYITGVWTQHTWEDAIGDYMMTSQSAFGNTDGSTSFWNFTNSPDRLTCAAMPGYGITKDGTLGRKNFYEARGYTVTECYNQKTNNTIPGGFSFAQFKAEIDAGRPVLLNLAGHSIVGVGYDDSASTVYIHDTWDYSNHSFAWGTSYSGMGLLSVSIVNIIIDTTPPVTTAVPAGGIYRTAQEVTLSANEPATIYYTTNGAEPTTGSPIYSVPVSVTSNTTLKFFAVDTAGGAEEVKTETYQFDTTPPVNGILTIAPGAVNTTLDLSWTDFSDALSGLASYKLVFGIAGYPACSAASLQSGTGTTFSHEGRTLGKTYYYRVCAIDNVGNISSGATASKKVLPEYEPPTGGVIIKNGAPYTKTATVYLKLSATDTAGPIRMCVSNGASCRNWVAYASTKSWTLSAGSGEKTVNVWFRDKYGNTDTKPYSDTIILDTTKPVNGTLTVIPGAVNTTSDLSWTGFSDTFSGLESYKLVFGTLAYPACSATAFYSGTETTFSHEGLKVGKTYYYRVCARDNAGNISSGATAKRKVLP
jgi:hypothetical protein